MTRFVDGYGNEEHTKATANDAFEKWRATKGAWAKIVDGQSAAWGIGAQAAWDHQQAEIDALTQELQRKDAELQEVREHVRGTMKFLDGPEHLAAYRALQKALDPR